MLQRVDVGTTFHTFEGLEAGTSFLATVEAYNAAGTRDGIEPAEITFATKDSRKSQRPLVDVKFLVFIMFIYKNACISAIIYLSC